MRARLKGAENAVGDILVFLDAHCEVTKGWSVEKLLLDFMVAKKKLLFYIKNFNNFVL